MGQSLAIANLRTAALALLVPPAFLYVAAYLFDGLGIFAIIVAVAIGIAGIASAPWPSRIRASVAAIYTLLAVLAAPLLWIVAVCTATGNCL